MLLSASILCACGGAPEAELKAPIVVAPNLKDPPAWMLEGCPKLAALPESAMKQEDVEKAWAADLGEYEDCRVQYYALRNFYKNRDAKLRSAK